MLSKERSVSACRVPDTFSDRPARPVNFCIYQWTYWQECQMAGRKSNVAQEMRIAESRERQRAGSLLSTFGPLWAASRPVWSARERGILQRSRKMVAEELPGRFSLAALLAPP